MVTPADRCWDGPRAELATHADARRIAGCERCREHLVAACGRAGFEPVVEFETDDYVAVQALVAAGLGVSLLPGLTLLANLRSGVSLHRIPGMRRQVVAAVYGKPPASQPAQVPLDAARHHRHRAGMAVLTGRADQRRSSRSPGARTPGIRTARDIHDRGDLLEVRCPDTVVRGRGAGPPPVRARWPARCRSFRLFSAAPNGS
ncbi:LysR substrate-binding domain-containing protein [Streptomyces sp. L7]